MVSTHTRNNLYDTTTACGCPARGTPPAENWKKKKCNFQLILVINCEFAIHIYYYLSLSFGQMRTRNRHRRKSIVTNLRYADDTTLIAGTKEDIIEIMVSVRKTSEKASLYI